MVAKTSVVKQLEELYKKNGNQLCLFYGRLDANKEVLLRAFLQNKKYFYYRARNASPQMQLRMMGDEISKQFDISINKFTYDECFNRVRSGDPSKLVVVIDEFQLIMKKDESFWESIKKLRNKRLYPGPVLILLCTTSLVFAQKELQKQLQEETNIFDSVIKIRDLNFLEVVRAFPDLPVSECVKIYGVTGGVSGYINHWDKKRDIKSNIIRNVLSENGYLFDAAERLIRSELRELSVYETILASLANGIQKLNDLYLQTGYSRAKISVYLKNLAAFDIIEKVVSFETGGWDNAQKGIYRIKDHYVNFWFHFIYPHLSDLYQKNPQDFYEAFIEPNLDDYMNRFFSEVCMEYLGLLNVVGKLPLKIEKMGTWVGKEGTIDIIAQNTERENIVCSCNWSKEVLSKEQYYKLLYSMKKAKISAAYIYLFSATDFSDELKEMAQTKKQLVLIDMKQL